MKKLIIVFFLLCPLIIPEWTTWTGKRDSISLWTYHDMFVLTEKKLSETASDGVLDYKIAPVHLSIPFNIKVKKHKK